MVRKQTTPSVRGHWSSDWSVGIGVWVERQGKTVLAENSADLLAALDRTKSISAAARVLGISYRHAWLMIQEVNQNAGQPLTATAVGGQHGGGARLTEYGHAALAVFEQLQASLRDAASKALPKILASTGRETSVLHLYAAISLQEVVARLLSEYALARPTVSVRTIFGASNELADQVLAGGAADLFLSAGKDQLDRLAERGVIRNESRRTLATNGLAVVATKPFKGNVRQPADLVALVDVPLHVADPACPLGQCTADFLRGAGVYDALRPKLLTVDNSRAVIAALRADGPRLGIIFSSDIINAPPMKTLLEESAGKVKTIYEGAVTTAAAVPTEATALLEFFGSKSAQAWFRRCGFST